MPNHNPNLPVNLLLLLHLHILSYPYCNAPEYTPDKLFPPTRPLRERTKTMEDIIAFLIQTIEGKSKCKAILHDVYPCLQPSDTVAFRVNATKYLEKLRASCVRGAAAPASTSNSRTSRLMKATISSNKSDLTNKSRKAELTTSSSQSVASDSHLWWSAVVVRKSLLEECCGDKFGRLLLALSTHALYTQIQSAALKNLIKSPKDIQNVLRGQPPKYAALLAQAQEKQEKLVREISDLNLRTQAFVSFRNQLQAINNPTDLSKLDIGQLTALQDSAYQDVLKLWKYSLRGETQANADDKESSVTPEDSLEWFLALSSNFPVDVPDILSKDPNTAEPETTSNTSPINLTLPVAAANHPAMLKKLTSFPHIMSIEEVSESQRDVPTGSNNTFESLPMIQKMLNDSSRDKEVLQELLDTAIQEKKRLEAKLKRVAKDIPPNESVPEVKLWMPPEEDEDFESAQIDGSTLEYLRHAGITGQQETEETIQQRFDESVSLLRESLNPETSSMSESQLSTSRQEKEVPSHVSEDYDQTDPSLATPRPSKVPVRMTELTDTVRRVPVTPRRSTLLPSMLATFSRKGYSQDLLADVSLPDVSVASVGEQNPNESHEDDVPFEGHSVTLRDMLLDAEAYDEGSFNLMDNAILEESDDDFAQL